MKLILFVLVIPVLVSATCKNNKSKENYGVPTCVQARIDSIKMEPKWNPPAQVDEYQFNGRSVYYFSSNCCDQFNTVIDNNCEYVCAPNGGITGKGDGKCPGFDQAATHTRLVWKDPR